MDCAVCGGSSSDGIDGGETGSIESSWCFVCSDVEVIRREAGIPADASMTMFGYDAVDVTSEGSMFSLSELALETERDIWEKWEDSAGDSGEIGGGECDEERSPLPLMSIVDTEVLGASKNPFGATLPFSSDQEYSIVGMFLARSSRMASGEN